MLEQIDGLRKASVQDLQKRYIELFPAEKTPPANKVWLFRRIAFRLQELEYGGLSQKAQNRIKELIGLYDPVNNKAIRPKISVETHARTKARGRDVRLPIPGTIITKNYKGIKIEVKVLEKGFEYGGKVYKNLTAIADKITGAHWNGYYFFNL